MGSKQTFFPIFPRTKASEKRKIEIRSPRQFIFEKRDPYVYHSCKSTLSSIIGSVEGDVVVICSSIITPICPGWLGGWGTTRETKIFLLSGLWLSRDAFFGKKNKLKRFALAGRGAWLGTGWAIQQDALQILLKRYRSVLISHGNEMVDYGLSSRCPLKCLFQGARVSLR